MKDIDVETIRQRYDVRSLKYLVLITASSIIELGRSVVLDFLTQFRDDFENGRRYIDRFELNYYTKRRFELRGERLLKRFIANNPNDKRVYESYFLLGIFYRTSDRNEEALQQ